MYACTPSASFLHDIDIAHTFSLDVAALLNIYVLIDLDE